MNGWRISLTKDGDSIEGALKRWFSQLRTRLVLIVLLSVLPALAIILITGFEQRTLAEQKAQEDAMRIVTLAAANQELLVENTRGFLIALAHVAGINENEMTDCGHIFSHLVDEHYPFYTGFYLADLEGNIICSTPGESPDHLKSCPHYNNLILGKGFTVSTYHICRESGEGVISLGYPVYTDDDKLIGVVNAGIDLNWFNALAKESQLPEGSTLTVTDQEGTILAHYPFPDYWVGKKTNDVHAFQAMFGQRQGTISMNNSDGMRMLYAFTPLWSEEQQVLVAISTPASLAFADANNKMMRNLAFLALAAVLVAGFAWYLGEFLLVRQTRALVNTTGRLASGELHTRTGTSYGNGEIGRLAQSIDQMAESLEQREIERQKADEALRAYAINLEQSNRELQDFNSITSHDLQEPLRKIQVFSDLIQQRYVEVLDERASSYLKIINDSASRMQNLLLDLLDYSRITSRAKPFVSTDLNLVVKQVISDLEYKIESSQAQIEVEPLPAIDSDPDQMYQLFQNLISNALKFTKTGQAPRINIRYNGSGSPAERSTGAEGSPSMAKITVSDNGIGFDEKYARRIFQPFERLHGNHEYQGTGMGLAICRKIVERHNGNITGTGTPDQGATFIVELPFIQQKED